MTPYYILAAAAATEEGKVEGIIRQFGWHPQLFISQLVVFGIVIFALNKFAYKSFLTIDSQSQRETQYFLSTLLHYPSIFCFWYHSYGIRI